MQRQMRLRASADFQRVHRRGARVTNQYFVLLHLPNHRVESRVGFAIGKKLGGAVQRNRIKRRLRALMHERMAARQVPPGQDVVVIARHASRDATFEELSRAVDDVLARAAWR